ncbi:MAG: hypothetical protein Q9227_004611 [Pyrenula ochraceoflavens]
MEKSPVSALIDVEPNSAAMILQVLIDTCVGVSQSRKAKTTAELAVTKAQKSMKSTTLFPSLYEQDKKRHRDAASESSRLQKQMEEDKHRIATLAGQFIQGISKSQEPAADYGSLNRELRALRADLASFKESAARREREQRDFIQDQAAEIQSLKSNIQHIERYNDALEQHTKPQLTNLRQELHGLRADIGGVQRIHAEADKQIRHNINQLEQLFKREGSNNDLEQLSDKFATLSNEFTNLKDQHKAMQKQVSLDMEKLDKANQESGTVERETQLLSRFDELESKYGRVCEQVEAVNRDHKNLRKELDDLRIAERNEDQSREKLQQELNAKVDSLTSLLQTLEASHSSAKSIDDERINELREEIAKTKRDVQSMANDNTMRDQTIADHVDEELAPVKGASNELRVRLEKSTADITKDLKSATSQIQALSRRLDNVTPSGITSPSVSHNPIRRNNSHSSIPSAVPRVQMQSPQSLIPATQQTPVAAQPFAQAPQPPPSLQYEVQMRGFQHVLRSFEAKINTFDPPHLYNAVLSAVTSRINLKDLSKVPNLEAALQKYEQTLNSLKTELNDVSTTSSINFRSLEDQLGAWRTSLQSDLKAVEDNYEKLATSVTMKAEAETLEQKLKDLMGANDKWKLDVDAAFREVCRINQENCETITTKSTESLRTRTDSLEQRAKDFDMQLSTIKKRQSSVPSAASDKSQRCTVSATPAPTAGRASRTSGSETPRAASAANDNEASNLLSQFQRSTNTTSTGAKRPALWAKQNGQSTSATSSKRNGSASAAPPVISESDESEDDAPISSRRNANPKLPSSAVKKEGNSQGGPFDLSAGARRTKLMKRKKESIIDLVDTDDPEDKDYNNGNQEILRPNSRNRHPSNDKKENKKRRLEE